MYYFYHGVPEPMAGTVLIPLNNMVGQNSKLRLQHLAKYKGREEILERRIPLLDCLWNDVIQLLPMDPQKVFELQAELTLLPKVPAYKFFKIDPSSLDPDKTIVFFKTAPGEENTEVKWLRDVDIASLQEIPEATRNYFKSLQSESGDNRLPFNYQFIPHICYMGTIETENVPIVTLH
jgi:hypothetical protein